MEERIVVNVKGVQKTAWNALVRDAAQRHEHYGLWLSEAIQCRLRCDAGINNPQRVALTPDQMTARIVALAELAKGLAALRAAGSRTVGVGALVRAVGEVAGGKAGGKTALIFEGRQMLEDDAA